LTIHRTRQPARGVTNPTRRLKFCEELTKYLFLDFAIAIILPPFITIPLRLQGDATGQHLGATGLVGLPDILLSFAILAWAAFRNTLDADHLNESVKVMALVFAVTLGLVNIGLAVWERSVTLANFWSANPYLCDFCLGALAASFALSASIAIARGMQNG